MRILIATPSLCWPLRNGGNAAQFSTLQCLSADHEFTLVVPIWNNEAKAQAIELAAQLPRVKIRTVELGAAASPPTAVLGRLARRIVRVARSFPSIFDSGRKATKDPTPSALSEPYNPFYPLSAAYITALAEEIRRGVDLCQAEFAEMMQLGAWFPRTLPRIFVHHQIHTVYAQRFIDTFGRQPHLEYLVEVMRAQERAYLQQFDGIIAFSEHDRLMLGDFAPIARIFTSPFPLPADVGLAPDPAPSWNGRFVFIGSEDHLPNQDALSWLLESIWPKIATQIPLASLTIIGKWSTPWHKRHPAPRVEFSGFVDDLSAAIRGTIMLVPLRIGSGIRTKIIVALAQGVPTVTTVIGSEGLPLSDGIEASVRSEASTFADAAIELARDPALWNERAAASLRLAAQHFLPEHVRARRNEIYAAIVKAHRASLPRTLPV